MRWILFISEPKNATRRRLRRFKLHLCASVSWWLKAKNQRTQKTCQVSPRCPAVQFSHSFESLVLNTKRAHIVVMQIELPKAIEARLSPKSAALRLAIGLYVTDEATLGQAAEAAGISQGEFLQELGQRHIPLHYGAEELAGDLRVIASICGR
jgi:predicted HTH domain antitoxin